jgi:hypothetical protein
MDTPHHDQLVFHLTGRCQGPGLIPLAGTGLRPALLAAYRDLPAVRHDFPMLLAPAGGPELAHTLSSLVESLLQDLAARGVEAERLRRHALQLETLIRRDMDGGARGTLSALWDAATLRLGGGGGGVALEKVLTPAEGALRAFGELLGCVPEMPARLITHAWQAAYGAKARAFRADRARLLVSLSDILRAAHSRSQAGCQPQALKSSLGGAYRDAFDFDALSRIVGKGVPQDELPAGRRQRLMRTLATLQDQRFFPTSDADEDADADAAYGFVFDNCAAAARAYAERLPSLAELVKAMSIAELEIQGRYAEAEHDIYFEAFDTHMLSADDLARFPDYLVCMPPDRNDAPENAKLMELLSACLPLKVLVQTHDLQEDAAIGTGHYAFGVRSARLATTAMGLGGLFVLQSPSSNLVALRQQLMRGMACRGPALFSVYAPQAQPGATLPPYLDAAAAMHSRAFAAFCYDAQAGANWAERFSLVNNPEPEADWPVETLEYADAQHQRISQPGAFTYADFVLCDPGQAAHFALVPRDRWSGQMLPAADWLQLPESQAASHVPYVLAVDDQDTLQRVIVDMSLMQATRRCLLLWHRLQEHGGVNDSHAQRLLAQEKAAWLAAQAAALAPAAAAPAAPVAVPAAAASPAVTAPAAAAAPAAADAAPAPVTGAPAHSRDEAWIDTPSCPSCNECQLVNDRMFAYDNRKQAYIKDITAGTYQQLVEAAEGCQVAIIHPGKPRDPNEPGLEELLARAEPFR